MGVDPVTLEQLLQERTIKPARSAIVDVFRRRLVAELGVAKPSAQALILAMDGFAIEQHGVTLFLLGVAVTLIPQVVVFYFSYYVLRIRNPIEALACVAGGRSANPALAALMAKTGNATPVVAFTVTYAVANVFLTLWGPVIVGIITKNAAP